ncbi:hypothetical protein ACFP9V_12260 [Deinococcus radiopugnans]|uniref:hypothetical protein n=1 Tax=Deinococcus radiopugnans TaxID=57497 RepID=UPI0036165DAC
MGAADRLVEAVCAAPGHSLAAPLRGWCASSRPFLAFAQANTTKLRRKVREAAGLEAQADVWAELAVAAWLLRSGSGTLTYEPLKAGEDAGQILRCPCRMEASCMSRWPGSAAVAAST